MHTMSQASIYTRMLAMVVAKVQAGEREMARRIFGTRRAQLREFRK